MMLTTISAPMRYDGLSSRSAAGLGHRRRPGQLDRPAGGASQGPRKTVLDADLLDDGVWRSLTPHKLIRRSLSP